LLLTLCSLCVNAQKKAKTVKKDTVSFAIPAEKEREVLRFNTADEEKGEIIRFEGKDETVTTLKEQLEITKTIFRRDFFVFGLAGYHTFVGDYSSNGKFEDSLSPEFGGGIGFWFSPYFGVSAQFLRSESTGFSEYVTGDYGFGYGEIMYKENGTPYRKMKTEWWDVSASLKLNVSRFIMGYEGYRGKRNKNQFILNLGGGCLYHLGYDQQQGTGYEWTGHVELQYSRFFRKKRRLSVDVKARWMFMHTNFDYESKRHDRLVDRMDSHFGVQAGLTCYLGKLSKAKKAKMPKIPESGMYDYSK
jgi:hypothetical protein